jgi:hypothetical protein
VDEIVIDENGLFEDLIILLRFSIEVLRVQDWNVDLSYRPAAETVINHLIDFVGDPYPTQPANPDSDK